MRSLRATAPRVVRPWLTKAFIFVTIWLTLRYVIQVYLDS